MARFFGPRPDMGLAYYHSHCDPLPEFPALRYVSEDVCLANHNLDPHSHELFEICYIHGGRGEWFAAGQKYPIEAGQLYITRPGEVHGGRADAQSPYHIFALCLDIRALPNIPYRTSPPSSKALPPPAEHAADTSADSDVTMAVQEAQSLHDEFLALNHRVVPCSVGAGLEHTFRKILTELDSVTDDPRGRALKLMMIQALLIELLVVVARAYANHGATCVTPALPPPGDPRLMELLRFVNSRLADPPTLQQMADRIGLSPAYLAVLFKQHTGQTPLEYLTAARVLEGAKRLRESSASITDIALDLGFVTPQYFSLVFKKHKGCTPTEWRERRP